MALRVKAHKTGTLMAQMKQMPADRAEKVAVLL
jgi:hypothetical protein